MNKILVVLLLIIFAAGGYWIGHKNMQSTNISSSLPNSPVNDTNIFLPAPQVYYTKVYYGSGPNCAMGGICSDTGQLQINYYISNGTLNIAFRGEEFKSLYPKDETKVLTSKLFKFDNDWKLPAAMCKNLGLKNYTVKKGEYALRQLGKYYVITTRIITSSVATVFFGTGSMCTGKGICNKTGLKDCGCPDQPISATFYYDDVEQSVSLVFDLAKYKMLNPAKAKDFQTCGGHYICDQSADVWIMPKDLANQLNLPTPIRVSPGQDIPTTIDMASNTCTLKIY